MPNFRFVSKETVYYETVLKAENEEQANKVFSNLVLDSKNLIPIEYEDFEHLFCSISFEENENA
jgi:hypothetical protein